MNQPLSHADESEVMTLKEVAALLRVSPATIYRLVNARQIPAIKVGRTWRFPTQAVRNWMSRVTDEGLRPDLLLGEPPHKDDR